MQVPPELPNPSKPLGRPFTVAMSVLGIVAVLQLGALIWVGIKRGTFGARDASGVASGVVLNGSRGGASASASAAVAEANLKPVPADAAQQQESAMDTSLLEDQVAAEAERRLLESIPRPTPVVTQREITPASRVADLINLARTLRDRGDTSTALTRLREAQTISPQNLQIISEMAITYERMRLIDKAVSHWRRIYEMGEKAGIYYAAAEAKLSALQLPSEPNAPQQALPASVSGGDIRPPESSTALSVPGAELGVGDVRTVDDTGNTQFLRRLKLRIPIVAQAEAVGAVDVNDVVIQVFFYDQLKSGGIVETNANVDSSWVSSPIDWSSSEPEVLEVTYAQAELGLAAAPDEERRNYFGYAVRVYYKGDLNALYAEPKKVLQTFPPSKTLNTPSSDLPQ
jgi:hypothetical protein